MFLKSSDGEKEYFDDEIILQALELLLKDKLGAFEAVKSQGFRREDFAIPQIESMIKILDEGGEFCAD